MHRIRKTIAEAVTGSPVCAVAPSDPVSTAVERMVDGGSSCVLVVEGDVLVGIFTEQDFFRRVAHPGVSLSTPIVEVMSTRPEALRDRDCVTYAIHKMVVGGYRNVPIVDAEGRAVEVLRVRDVIAHLADVFEEAERDDTVEDFDSDWVDLGGGG
jgi:CBS domain-containing protein